MRRVIRKRIRQKAEGVELALDFNADVAINTGGSQVAQEQHDRRRREEDSPERPGERQEPDTEGRER
jgi:hypothetical protein